MALPLGPCHLPPDTPSESGDKGSPIGPRLRDTAGVRGGEVGTERRRFSAPLPGPAAGAPRSHGAPGLALGAAEPRQLEVAGDEVRVSAREFPFDPVA